MILRVCKYCKKELKFKSKNHFASHVGTCTENPNLERKKEKLKNFNTLKRIKVIKSCEKCGKEFEVERTISKEGNQNIPKKEKRFCSQKCANSHIQTEEMNEARRKKLKGKPSPFKRHKLLNKKWVKIPEKEIKLKEKKRNYCKYCGSLKGTCIKPNICKKYNILPTLIKYFNFNPNVLGTFQYYEEYITVVNNIKKDYYEREFSLQEINDKYNYYGNLRNLSKILDSLGIERRTLSESSQKAFLNKKNSNNFYNPIYKNGWHNTWNNKQVYYRSSYELEFAKNLDTKKIDYEMEELRILYWDTQLKKERVAIPDFYIKNENKIIEIKSEWTYDKINMDDKIKAYKKHGYNFQLYVDDLNKPFFEDIA